jgi:RNA polymerase sigma-70 factor (ECF subfamily)
MHPVNVLPRSVFPIGPETGRFEVSRVAGSPLPVQPRPAAPAVPADAPAADPAELVRRIQDGDTRAEAELVERHRAALLFLLRRWTREPETAEDLCQETLRLAIQKIRQGEVREPERLTAFLRGLAKNQSIQLYRRTGERSEMREELDSSCEVPDARPNALTLLLRNEKARLARQVLQDLGSERDRQILLRYYLAEEKAEAICQDLGLTSEHFYRVLYRARQRYRRLFEEQLEELT